MKKKTYDLHDIYNQSKKLEDTLNEAIKEAVEKKIKTIEIIPGKGSGQLKKRVLRFLNQSHIKTQYHRIDKDSKNFGRLFVHFRHS
ncbi:DNA mismatch repair protein MutS [bacterium]|nr:DNA mismatch repair protein MutS [bacterium]|tara:strand:- start:194 stop:451 length:258 start_codon:yes stop_codon:yes gene_type:complete